MCRFGCATTETLSAAPQLCHCSNATWLFNNQAKHMAEQITQLLLAMCVKSQESIKGQSSQKRECAMEEEKETGTYRREPYSGADRHPAGGDESSGDERGEEEEHAAVTRRCSSQAPREPGRRRLRGRRGLHHRPSIRWHAYGRRSASEDELTTDDAWSRRRKHHAVVPSRPPFAYRCNRP